MASSWTRLGTGKEIKYPVRVDWRWDKLINARGISNARLGKGNNVRHRRARLRAKGSSLPSI